MELDLDALLAVAGDLADAADELTLDRFGGRVPAVRKIDGSPVTEADTAVERRVRELLAERCPEHAVLGEEEGGRVDPHVPTWVIDPIDSTKNFMRGLPMYATLIGVVQAGRAVLGVASMPAMGERWTAAVGRGAHCNGETVGVSRIADLADAHVLHGGLDWFRSDPQTWERFGRIADLVWRTRGFGDFWMHLLVAGGAAEVAFERDLKIWDVAALECIVTEAGGSFTAWDGGSALTSGDAIASNGVIHEAFRELLEGPLPS